jgi:23S rRNA (adenine2503-C2)-methyltransferase
MKILDKSGKEEVAIIYIAQLRENKNSVVEIVDGLDTNFKKEEKWIINISTQFGCPVGCIFCDAGGEYFGNLTSDEMIEEVQFIMNKHENLVDFCKKLKVHFARVGEPSLNDEVLKTIPKLRELTENPNLWCCIPTIVPKNRDRWFEELVNLKNEFFLKRFQLQISMNSTNQEERLKLMPVNLHDFKWIANYGDRFYSDGDRKIALNFALSKNSEFNINKIREYFQPEIFAIKLTPLNPTYMTISKNLETKIDAREKILNEQMEELSSCGYDDILSIGDLREDEIGSNCGQSLRKLGLRNGELRIKN